MKIARRFWFLVCVSALGIVLGCGGGEGTTVIEPDFREMTAEEIAEAEAEDAERMAEGG